MQGDIDYVRADFPPVLDLTRRQIGEGEAAPQADDRDRLTDGLSTFLVLRRMHGRCLSDPGPAWHEPTMMVIDPAMDGPMAFRTVFHVASSTAP